MAHHIKGQLKYKIASSFTKHMCYWQLNRFSVYQQIPTRLSTFICKSALKEGGETYI